MRKSAWFGFSAMLLAFVLALLISFSVLVALVATATTFYIWGMVLAYQVLEARYKAACKRHPWMGMSEGAEVGYMVWFWFSWLAYGIERSMRSIT